MALLELRDSSGRHRAAKRRLGTYRHWVAAVALAAAVLLAAPGALAAAQIRIGLNGGRPTEWPILSSVLASQGLTQEGWLAFASRVGENWLPNSDPVALDYPGQLGIVSGPNALTADQSTAAGQKLLHALILNELQNGQTEPIAVAGLSEGTLVIDAELAYLATNPADAPNRDALTFYVFGDMLRGLGQMYLRGITVPFIGQTFGPVPETKYDTVVVNEQWDGWANPPDRPWNLLADLNAVMGAVYTVNGSNDHSQTSLDSLADAIEVSETVNSLGGKTTTYLVPRQQLPLTRPLRQLGIPDWAVDELDKLLMPLINYGYSNITPYLGPRIENDQLVFTPPTPPVTTPVVTTEENVVTPEETDTAITGTASVNARKSAAVAAAPVAADEATPALTDRPPLQNPEVDDAGAPAAVDPEPAAVDPIGSGATNQQDQPAADTGTSVGSPKDDPEPKAVHRPRPGHVDGATDAAGTTDADGTNDAGKPRHQRPDSDADTDPRRPKPITKPIPKPIPKPVVAGTDASGTDSAGTTGPDSSSGAASAA
jgi:hypothetical protein